MIRTHIWLAFGLVFLAVSLSACRFEPASRAVASVPLASPTAAAAGGLVDDGNVEMYY